jgi:hypothetical protein
VLGDVSKYPLAHVVQLAALVEQVLQVEEQSVQEPSAAAKYPLAQTHFVVLSEHVKQDLSHKEQAESLG